VATYDRLIEGGVAGLAACIVHPSPENEARYNATLLEALAFKSGRTDGQARREDMVDVMFDVVLALSGSLKARLIETVPAKLGISREEFERAVIPVMQLMTRAEIEQMLDAQLGNEGPA
jgi:hypothetical protein